MVKPRVQPNKPPGIEAGLGGAIKGGKIGAPPQLAKRGAPVGRRIGTGAGDLPPVPSRPKPPPLPKVGKNIEKHPPKRSKEVDGQPIGTTQPGFLHRWP